MGILHFSLEATIEATIAFDMTSPHFQNDWVYGEENTKKISFFCIGLENIDIEQILREIVNDRAEVITTGKTSIIGEAFSPGLAIWLIGYKNREENSFLLKIDLTTLDKSKNQSSDLAKKIVIEENTIVLNHPEEKEITDVVASHLKNISNKIVDSNSKKPKFFVVH